MEISLYDTYLPITKDGGENFGIAEFQTDNTFNVGTETFMKKEEKEILEAKFKVKTQTILETSVSGNFNGYCMKIEVESIVVVQKNQVEKLVLEDIKDKAKKQQYVEQCARGAYIASICQPEATFDYSIAAQLKKPSDDNIDLLNKRIQWQLDNKMRGRCFKAIDLSNAKLFVFIDGSFANNKDHSSQIGYVIVFANKYSYANTNEVTIKGSIFHWSLTKCQRVT